MKKKDERKPRVVIITDRYHEEIKTACWLAGAEPRSITVYDLNEVVEVAAKYGADVGIVRGSMVNRRMFPGKNMGDEIIKRLEEVGIKTMCVTFAAYSSQKAPYPIARTVQRKESVIAMCEFIQKKGDVGDAFRAPID